MIWSVHTLAQMDTYCRYTIGCSSIAAVTAFLALVHHAERLCCKIGEQHPEMTFILLESNLIPSKN
jgi:hypothetical protein